MRRLLASVLGASLVVAALPAPVSAIERPRAASGADLHRTILTQRAQVEHARANVQAVLAQTDVQARIRRVGLDARVLATRVSKLSDAEILRLESQLMDARVRLGTSGLGGGAIAAIVIVGVAGTVAIMYIILSALDTEADYSY
jgi:hypothetical protein